MFLKRLDVFGFKSFADRIELEIAPGVTAVVGPNGSGKSNISDAIRWVLGEQSARSLRGAKMEDVIFSGSQARKAVNFCEVTLTLDNRERVLPLDYAEVSVTRRVYRSGESEYLINKSPCRLRDISELFMDTGVGREAYSIIGQGRIEEILSNKSDERRGVFEEAAGIVKFKWRRREAERKLAEADQNLLRIQDILSELDGQVLSLEKKAEIAKQYKQVVGEVERLHIMVLAADIHDLAQKRMAMIAEQDALQAKLILQEQKEAESEDQISDIKAQFDDVETEYSALSSKFIDATSAMEQCEANRRVSVERQEHMIAQVESLREQRVRVIASQASLKKNVELNEHQVSVLEQQVRTLREEVRVKLDEQDGHGVIALLRSKIAESRASMIEVMRRQASDRNEQKTLSQERTKHVQKLERYDRDIVELDTLITQLQKNAEDLNSDRQALELSSKDVAIQSEALYDELLKEEQYLSQVGVTAEQLERHKVEIVSRHRTLQDLQSDLDGYASGPKAILRSKQRAELQGIHGVIADLVQVSKEYEIAIEIALGGSLQHVVVETESDARAAIEYLKKRQLGRATFLPLVTITGRKLAVRDVQTMSNIDGFLGVASDLVQTDTKYQAVIESLLGNVVIAKQLAQANVIAKMMQYRTRIVTIAGDVVNPGGSMTGGSTGRRGTTLLGRAREIQLLEEQMQEITIKLDSVQMNKKNSQVNVKTLRDKREKLQTELGRLVEQVRAYDLKQNMLIAECKTVESKRQALEQEREFVTDELSICETQLDALASALQVISEEGARSESELKALEDHMLQEEARVIGHHDLLTDLRVSLAEQEEALRGAIVAGDQLSLQLDALRVESERLDGEQQKMILRMGELSQVLQEQERLATEAIAARSEVSKLLESVRMIRTSLLQQIEASDHFSQAIRAESLKLRQKVHQVDVHLSKLDGELETKTESLRNDYELGFELAQQRYPLIEPLDVARVQLADLKRQLDALGEVNILAIEEYEQVRERQLFLQTEASDLTHAREQLQALISDIDSEMSTRFMESFADIRRHFREVFASLFEGGQADVFLLDEANPLQSGIEITAEPPGKKMQTLSLLSGGERALTALALLFAILHVKPVPFCVLDEVEAALDEANVSRFADYLQSFARQTQFVVITHRRGTMEAADVLYGVTMQDSGISKLVSVRVLEEETASA